RECARSSWARISVGAGRREGSRSEAEHERPHARRSLSTLSVRARAPTKQLGPYRRPAALLAATTPAVPINRGDDHAVGGRLQHCSADLPARVADYVLGNVG